MKRQMSTRGRRLRFEALERKQMLSGTPPCASVPSATLKNGDLSIVGTPYADEVAVFQLAVDVTDVGSEGDYVVIILSGGPTPVYTQVFPDEQVTGDITITTCQGNDTVVVGNVAALSALLTSEALAVPGVDALVASLGTAFTPAVISTTDIAQETFVCDSLKICTNDGDDYVALWNVVVGECVTIDTGNADLTPAPVTTEQVLLGPDDVVQVFGGFVSQSITIKTGDGDDVVDILPVPCTIPVAGVAQITQLLPLLPSTPAQIGDNLKIYTNGGDDTIELVDIRVGENVCIDTGNADLTDNVRLAQVDEFLGLDDSVLITGGFIAYDLSIKTGNGNDVVEIVPLPCTTAVAGVAQVAQVPIGGAGIPTTVGDDLCIYTNGGDDITALQQMNVGGDVCIDTGNADLTPTAALKVAQFPVLLGPDDTVEVFGGFVGHLLKIKTGNGNDVVAVEGVPCTADDGAPAIEQVEQVFQQIGIGDNLEIYTNGGADIVDILAARVGQNLCLNTGSGGDTVNIAELFVARKASINTTDKCASSTNDADTVNIGVFPLMATLTFGLKAGDLTIDTGNDSDVVTLDDVKVCCKTSICTGNGEDFVYLTDLRTGELYIDLGAGNDTLDTSGGGNRVARRTYVDGGTGTNTWLGFDAAGNQFNGLTRKRITVVV